MALVTHYEAQCPDVSGRLNWCFDAAEEAGFVAFSVDRCNAPAVPLQRFTLLSATRPTPNCYLARTPAKTLTIPAAASAFARDGSPNARSAGGPVPRLTAHPDGANGGRCGAAVQAWRGSHSLLLIITRRPSSHDWSLSGHSPLSLASSPANRIALNDSP